MFLCTASGLFVIIIFVIVSDNLERNADWNAFFSEILREQFHLLLIVLIFVVGGTILVAIRGEDQP